MTTDGPTAAATSIGTLGAALHARLAGDGNLVWSPASVAFALAMARAGAAGDTAAQLDAVLGAGAADDVTAAMADAAAALRARAGTTRGADGTDVVVELSIADGVWVDHGIELTPAFTDSMTTVFRAAVEAVDFAGRPDEARVAINDWIARATAGRIRDLLVPGTIHALTRVVLADAVHLKAPWRTPFPPTATHDAVFTTLGGAEVTVPTMRVADSFEVATGDDWTAVTLPYAGGALELLVVVPDAGRFADVEARLGTGLLDDAVAGRVRRHVQLTLPRFAVRTTASLRTALGALGVTTAFGPGADFGAMTRTQGVWIDDVVHAADITVDEAGTEAAAVTVVMMRATAMPLDPLELAVDRPFLFALRDAPTGVIAFLGRVTDPSR